ncbi:hypothetical protein [Nostoc sp. ATCC 53789]|uniref:hypothetical protein n=1 Tax=Nostoc sp. ATCC 53789 TaxID=76335 RepID=UPI000DECBA6F|nr:hypothetical protein [Nostoc sp. ATCC 53789]QHG20913.1 hypothetical protein GJB62_34080 [Nostoc sp. ATCC 53789]QHG20986.1 hypothetical protein GJB62_34600 [Nostoc sp. ATCC 53789]RCJ32581.1 hypothetical protein A6V25_35005 [Nostoc sp. ATCC 53789]
MIRHNYLKGFGVMPRAHHPMPNAQCPMLTTLKIDWRLWGFGGHGLVVMMINIYIYRERDYGIRT